MEQNCMRTTYLRSFLARLDARRLSVGPSGGDRGVAPTAPLPDSRGSDVAPELFLPFLPLPPPRVVTPPIGGLLPGRAEAPALFERAGCSPQASPAAAAADGRGRLFDCARPDDAARGVLPFFLERCLSRGALLSDEDESSSGVPIRPIISAASLGTCAIASSKADESIFAARFCAPPGALGCFPLGRTPPSPPPRCFRRTSIPFTPSL
eukprot:COSAG06_NODE_13038_length_1299_cov_9.876667_1_plen_208_part_01